MLKGILLGSASALALSALFIVSVALIVPPPERSARPAAQQQPAAPVLRDQAEATPRVPEPPAPRATVAEVDEARTTRSDTVGQGVELPAGSQFNRPPEDGAARLPGTDRVARAGTSEGLARATAPAAAPAPQTQSAGQPAPVVISGFGAVPEAGDAPAVPVPPAERAPQTFGAVSEEIAESLEDDVVVEAEGPADAAAEEADEPATPEDNEVAVETEIAGGGETAAASVEPEADDAPVPEAVADAPAAPEAPEGAETAGAPATLPREGEITLVETPLRVPTPEVETESPEADDDAPLPRRLVLDSERAAEATDDGETEGPPRALASLRALDRNAAEFDNPEGLPLMSVVLIDDPAGGVDRESLAAFDFPVTFALDPTRPDAKAAAAAYRAAGHEVVALADGLPRGASAQDIEVAMAALRLSLPQAIGMMDRASAGIAGDRAALDALLPVLDEAGMGFLAYPNGLNSGVTTARAQGVPAATLYRRLDSDGERAPRIVRYLDRATFEAAQNGATVVVGRTTPETVTALYSWRQGNRAEQIAPAPLSAVLRAVPTGG
ncbi:divergent polysaccharide deacetylase family protein [Jannaschia marina]|uniref:divergent polysaccharide deacetylase family protein n=1 Tax=Jannaschia marina TaxID=2741674 RepID=UPI0015CE1D7E|nr:divergent polysaccharide deacetylase family protein [Jannaschia marina]